MSAEIATIMGVRPIAVHGERCLHRWHKAATCLLCEDGCPAGAISLYGSEVVLDGSRCIGCGACLTACPTEVFISGRFSERHVLANISELQTERAELLCAMHANSRAGGGSSGSLMIQTCLAALSPGLLVECGLVAQVNLRVDACATCKLGCARVRIEGAATFANAWLTSIGRTDAIVLAEAPSAATPGSRKKQRVFSRSADTARVSRRDFLRGLTDGSSLLAAILGVDLDFVKRGAGSVTHPRGRAHVPGWRRALSQAWPVAGEAQMGSSPWPRLRIQPGCKGCLLCEKCCPTGAICSAMVEGRFVLRFTPGFCVDCGLCVRACSSERLALEHAPTERPFESCAIFDVRVGSCARCSGPALDAGTLCHMCASEPSSKSLLTDAVRQLLMTK